MYIMYLVFFILCSYDYLKITNENNDNTTKYCGVKTGHTFVVTGNHAVLIFHTGSIEQRKGFLLSFTAVPQGKFHNCYLDRRTTLPRWDGGGKRRYSLQWAL